MTTTTNHSSRALLIALIPMIAVLSLPANAEQMRSVTHVYKNGQNHPNLVLNYGAAPAPIRRLGKPTAPPAPCPVPGAENRLVNPKVCQALLNQNAEAARQQAVLQQQQAVQQQQMVLQQQMLQSRMERRERRDAMRDALIQGVLGMINRGNGGE